MKNQDDSKKTQIKSILSTNFKEKGRDSKRISWGESKVMQYQKGKNTTIIEEKNESNPPIPHNENIGIMYSKRQDDDFLLNNLNQENKDKINNVDHQQVVNTNYGEKEVLKEIGKDLIQNDKVKLPQNNGNVYKVKDNVFMKLYEDTNKKQSKMSRFTININDLLNKTGENSELEDQEENIKKKTSRLTINLKETIDCLNNDDSSDGSIDTTKYDPKNFFNTSSKRIQSSSKISLSPIMIEKDKLIFDVCNSSASRKLDYGEKLINTAEMKNIKHYDYNMEIFSDSQETKNEEKVKLNLENEKAKNENEPKLKANFSEIMEVDEGNFSKNSDDTPSFANICDTEKEDKRKKIANRETIDLNQILQIQKNTSDSNNVSSNNGLPQNTDIYIQSLSSHKKSNENFSNKYNLNPKNLPQSISKLFSPNTRNTLKSSSITNQMISPIKDSKPLNLETILKEGDVKKRLGVYLNLIEDMNQQNEYEYVETKNHISLLKETNREFNSKKEQLSKEKGSLESNYDKFSQEEYNIQEKIKITNSILNTIGLSIVSTENNQMKITIFNYIKLNINFKEFTRTSFEDHNPNWEITKITFQFDKIFFDFRSGEIKNELFTLYEDLVDYCFGLGKNSSIKINFPKFIENLKKILKYSSFIIYLIKCLKRAILVSHSVTFNCFNDKNLMKKKAKLSMNVINIQGILIEFKFEIEIFNCFYGINLLDFTMDNISHQKFSEQELNKIMSILKEVKNYFHNPNNAKLIFKLRDFINRAPNFLYK